MAEPIARRWKVLVAEDETEIRRTLCELLRSEGFETFEAENGLMALELLRQGFVEVALLDLMLPGMDGLEVLREARRFNEKVPVIMFTGFASIPSAVEAIRSGADDYVTKPLTYPELVSAVHKAMEERQTKQDVEARRELEARIRQSQKMEAIGRLASGVAHDFNNLITVITGYSDLLANCLGTGHAALEFVDEIRKAGERAASLTRQLLAFSRKQVFAPAALDVNLVVASMDKMLRRLIEQNIELSTRLDPALRPIKADPGQIEQIVMNLALNARDAMPQGGKLIIETATVELDESYVGAHPEARTGRHVMLAVSDTGVGMDADTQHRIFEPFFTTKHPGKGTGLGLSTVYGITKQMGGHIRCESEPGRGTTFRLFLPQIEEPLRLPELPPTLAEAPAGAETILLVDDEPALRSLARHVLEMKGYRVLEAGNAEQALKIGESHRGPIHLLVTDVIMPGQSGPRLAAQLSALRPSLQVLFLSGYSDDAIVHHGVLDSRRPFLQKPFTPEMLTQKVREVLDADFGKEPVVLVQGSAPGQTRTAGSVARPESSTIVVRGAQSERSER